MADKLEFVKPLLCDCFQPWKLTITLLAKTLGVPSDTKLKLLLIQKPQRLTVIDRQKAFETAALWDM